MVAYADEFRGGSGTGSVGELEREGSDVVRSIRRREETVQRSGDEGNDVRSADDPIDTPHATKHDQSAESCSVSTTPARGSIKQVARFRHLADTWREKTAFLSSLTEIATQVEYQQIIGMGPVALPFILQELAQEPEHWFWALVAITGEDPVPPTVRGNMREMADLWLQWGHSRGYV